VIPYSLVSTYQNYSQTQCTETACQASVQFVWMEFILETPGPKFGVKKYLETFRKAVWIQIPTLCLCLQIVLYLLMKLFNVGHLAGGTCSNRWQVTHLLNPFQPSDVMWRHTMHLSLICIYFAQ
jgi:hypothetical protein